MKRDAIDLSKVNRFHPLKMSVKSLKLSIRNIGYQCRIGSSALLGEATLEHSELPAIIFHLSSWWEMPLRSPHNR